MPYIFAIYGIYLVGNVGCLIVRENMNIEQIKKSVGLFTWLWDDEYFIEVDFSTNFIWSSPSYGGSNKIRPFSGSLRDYLKQKGIDYGRDKGVQNIGSYCGDVQFQDNGFTDKDAQDVKDLKNDYLSF